MTDFTKAEYVQMMRRCSTEITDLRARIATLEPKADAYEKLSIVLNLLPRQSISMSEDLVWRLNRRIKELEQEEKQNDVKAT